MLFDILQKTFFVKMFVIIHSNTSPECIKKLLFCNIVFICDFKCEWVILTGRDQFVIKKFNLLSQQTTAAGHAFQVKKAYGEKNIFTWYLRFLSDIKSNTNLSIINMLQTQSAF